MFNMGSSRQLYGKLLLTLAMLTFMCISMSVYYIINDKQVKDLGVANEVEPEIEYVDIQPLSGHWLKTAEHSVSGEFSVEAAEGPPQNTARASNDEVKLHTSKEVQIYSSPEGVRPEQIQQKRALENLNKDLDSVNVLYVWSDQTRLKVVSVMTLNRKNKRPAIVVLPLRTVITEEGKTLEEVFSLQGRDSIGTALEGKLEVKLHNFVHINNEALHGLSDILGPLQVEEEIVTMAQALEESAAGVRTNDDSIVRAVAKQAIRPATLLKVPALISVLTEHVTTDFSIQEIIQLLNYTRTLNLNEMEKLVLVGQDAVFDGRICKVVAEGTWQTILYEATN